MDMESFDAIVIGAGQAGIPLAKKLAQAGWKTALIEKRKVGGTCINDGCTPTKAMVASARMAYLASRSEDLGVEISDYSINFSAIMARKDEIVNRFRKGALEGIQKTNNLFLKYGAAEFNSNEEIRVIDDDGKVEIITGKRIFINTGTQPDVPEIEGLREVDFLNSTTILELTAVPEHLLIVGGGYIGLEFAQMFRRFGAKVTLLERGDRLMPKEDIDVCQVMSDIFDEDGIDVKINTSPLKFHKNSEQIIQVTLDRKGNSEVINCSHVLIATGRKPQTSHLGLERTNITLDKKGYISVNEFLETSVKNIYALGDVKGGPAFTHISYNDYVVVTNRLLQAGNKTTKDRMVPYCMFTDPQLGRVGLTEVEAKQKGLNYLVAKIPMKNVARAIEKAETRGFMKAIVDKDTKQILGATIIGEDGGEIMSILQMAMMGGITYEQIRFTIFAHPLYAESLNNLFMSIND